MKLPAFVGVLFLATGLLLARAQDLSVGLILDCSASMWNKLEDGRYRIDAAKDVLVDFLSSTPQREGLHIGLRIYGSRVPFAKAGACEDTVLVVPIEGFRREEMINAVRRARAIGATPLALSLQKAAGDFHKPGVRRLIVCTDGEESCGGDVEAALRALQEAGVDVDVQIIGIGLPEAAATRFRSLGVPVENVHSTRAFAEALAAAAQPLEEVKVEAVPLKIPVRLRLLRNGAPLAGHEVTVTNSLDGSVVAMEPGSEGEFRGQAVPGSYRVEVQPGGRIFTNQSVPAEREADWVFDLTEAPQVRVEVIPGEFMAGETMTVKFSGAAGVEEEWVGLSPAGSEEAPLLLWEFTGGVRQGELTFTAPAIAGEFRMVFYSPVAGEDVKAGESAVFPISLPEITLKVPAEVTASAMIPVEWQGPALPGDWICWVPAGAPDGAYDLYEWVSPDSRPLLLRGPGKPGAYEMRYGNQATDVVLARTSFTVIEAGVSLSAVEQAPAGSRISIDWKAPLTEGVYLTVVPAGSDDGTYLSYEYTARASNPVLLQTPREVGDAEIRVVAPGNDVLIRRPIRLVEMETWVRSPLVAETGSMLAVQWQGPGGEGDYITIVPRGAPEDSYLSYAGVGDTSEAVELQMPAEAGAYEIRYVTAESKVLARQPVEVK